MKPHNSSVVLFLVIREGIPGEDRTLFARMKT
jgi:hypothetical protein